MAGIIPEEALETVVRLSEGNPFMAAAMVRGLVESGVLESTAAGWRVEPARLAEVRSSRRAASLLLRRVELFSAETRALLVAGAILGREFEVELAAVLAQQSPEHARVVLEPARQRHLVWANGSQGRYTFAHDRIREALLEQLPAAQGRALHREAALELERRAPERSFELAWHFEAAGELERAWPHALKAAEAARREHALDLAERYYRLADAGAAAADGATRMALQEGLGDVLSMRSKPVEAEQCYMRAQAFATTRSDRARLEGRRGEVTLRVGRLPAAIDKMERALRIIGRKVPASPWAFVVCCLWEALRHGLRVLPSQRKARRWPSLEGEALLAARLYIELSRTYWFQGGGMVAGLWAHLRGLNIAERHAPSPELAAALANHGTALPMLARAIPYVPTFFVAWAMTRGEKRFQRALALREALGDAYEHGATLALYQASLLHGARYEESVEVGRRALQRFQQAGASSEGCAGIGLVEYFLGLALYFRGDLTGAVEQGQAMYRKGRDSKERFSCTRGVALWSCASGGQVPAEAIAVARALFATSRGDGFSLGQALLVRAEGKRLLRAGEPGQAVASLEQALQQVKPWSTRLVLFYSWVHVLLVTALREEASQLPSHAFSLRAGLLRRAKAAARKARRHSLALRDTLAPIFRELGLIAAMEGRNSRARRYFDRSLAIAERLDMRYERAQTLRARAEVGASLGWPEAAQDAAAAEEALRPMQAALAPAPAAEAQASLSLVDRFPRILEAGRAIASALTWEAVLSSVREAALGLLRGEDCVLVEATPEGLRASGGAGETVWPFLQRAQELKRPVVPSTEALESAGHGPERSVLCAPILVRGQVAALFCVTTRKLAGAFGPEELRIAEYIATLAGAALENAQGFAEVHALSDERERLYQEAQGALRKRDEFLAVASHELRTPFTPMRLYLQGLLNALRNPAKAAGLESWVVKLETANTRLQRLAKLVEELFDVSRMAYDKLPLRRGEVDLSLLAEEAGERWQEELARVGCTYTLKAPEPVVGHWDGMRLEQVIDNLLSNAMKFGPGQPIHLAVTKSAGGARLIVRDFGRGIAPEDQGRIFERFERAVSENYGGFGLGLWICREVVQAHGGQLSVESAPGQGATFTVELPLTPPGGADGEDFSRSPLVLREEFTGPGLGEPTG